MKNWKQIANYSVVDNAKAQAWWNRVGHYVMLCFITPGASLSLLWGSGAWLLEGVSRSTIVESVVWGPGLAFIAVVMRGYYVPRGYRRYFYVVCATPAIVGLLLSLACIATVLHSGVSYSK